jgi:hypothetical protein
MARQPRKLAAILTADVFGYSSPSCGLRAAATFRSIAMSL